MLFAPSFDNRIFLLYFQSRIRLLAMRAVVVGHIFRVKSFSKLAAAQLQDYYRHPIIDVLSFQNAFYSMGMGANPVEL